MASTFNVILFLHLLPQYRLDAIIIKNYIITLKFLQHLLQASSPPLKYLSCLIIIKIKQMISTSKRLLGGLRCLSMLRPNYQMNHIKNMNEENIRVAAQQAQDLPIVEELNRVYKPTYTIEFNREGEVLLYSGTPINSSTIYFKYPFILYESILPLAILNYALNPLDMVWYWTSCGMYFSFFAFIPRTWYYSDFKYYPNRLWLLRGGRVLKIESNNLGSTNYTYWLESHLCRPLTEDKMHFDDRDDADFLSEEGALKYDLNVEVEEFKFFGVNTNNQQLTFVKDGSTIHHPELFEAAVKGYTIDTTDFVINTADNVRYREGHYDV